VNTIKLIAGAQALVAALVLGGVWLGLPARYLWVDVPATALGVGALVAAFALVFNQPWAVAFARVLLWAELVLGTLTITLLGASVAQLSGSYGPVGAGGVKLMLLVAALLLPYLVVFPVLQLRALRGQGPS